MEDLSLLPLLFTSSIIHLYIWTRGCLFYTLGYYSVRLYFVTQIVPALAIGSSCSRLFCPFKKSNCLFSCLKVFTQSRQMPFVRNITCKYFLPVHDFSYQQLLNLHQSCLFRKLPLNPLSLPPNSILGSHFSLLCPPRQSPPQLPSQLQLLPRGGTQTYVCNPHFFSETQIHLFDCLFVIFPQTSPRPPKLNMFPNKLIT